MSDFKDSIQADLPLLSALHQAAQRSRAAFHTPGHKQGQGSLPALIAVLGKDALRADLPELPELDNLFQPTGAIAQAEALAAQAFGAEQTWFLANGSTCGIEAAVLAVCRPGEKLIVPRNVHQSVISAVILSGAVPVFVMPEFDPDWQLAHGVKAEAIATALYQHPDAKAVLVVSPTYYGVCSAVAEIAAVVHQQGLSLLVDEAHGAHFAFHPDLPTSALQAGADLAVQSIHKTLSALTQAAMLHVQGDRIDRQRLDRSLQLVQSTGPSYLLLASLDAARQQMATQGQSLWHHTLNLAQSARTRLTAIDRLHLLQPPPRFVLDATRLTLRLEGWTGYAADEQLHAQGVTCELPTQHSLTFLLTPGNTAADVDRLIHQLQPLARCPIPDIAPIWASELCTLPPARLTPRQAFFANAIAVPTEAAIDQVSAEMICPYPPGIPVLLPGEVITASAIAQLRQWVAAGAVLTGCTDPHLQTVRIVTA